MADHRNGGPAALLVVHRGVPALNSGDPRSRHAFRRTLALHHLTGGQVRVAALELPPDGDVRAPFVHVQVGGPGVYVRAPFVRIFVPRGPVYHVVPEHVVPQQPMPPADNVLPAPREMPKEGAPDGTLPAPRAVPHQPRRREAAGNPLPRRQRPMATLVFLVVITAVIAAGAGVAFTAVR